MKPAMWKADPAEAVQDFVLKETIFSEKSHLKRATLGPLEREKKIDVQRPRGPAPSLGSIR